MKITEISPKELEGFFNEESKYTCEVDGKHIPLVVSKKVPQGEIWFIELKSRPEV